ncbi:glycosyl transferase [Marinomonas ushuaiensis DSM 15871]|uniref:Glycosyl transferase n=1 Tax=Marinomonas ushuaiensis DSM 15871 TaxID=1122207 RepID=X7E4K1_9GAMM|nr:MJ1255/VC2487 family glycosyltransferase [Marinomonas ushuaiensis]ETX10800.1 glycosyl transferase [Marinomonas ushuaiensis DSM 15871]
MKILYGVQGTGNGHITRARAMAAEMKVAGFEVDFVFSGRAPEDYFDMAVFGDYRTFLGLSFVARNGKLDLLATCRKANFIKLIQDIRSLDTRGYDLVITDFEPIVAWAAKTQNVPCIGFGHQYAFKHDIPRYKKNILAQWVMSNFAPAATQLGAHWHHFGHPILPPLIHAQEMKNAPNAELVLVYLPFENSEAVLEWLEGVPGYRFRLHCKDIEPGVYGNVEVFAFSRQQFQQNLSECESVLCNAGFELNSEALQLGRRILAKPLKGQIEQHSNAIALEALGIAKTTDVLNADVILEWLETSRVVQISYPNVARAVVAWLQSDNDISVSDLCESLWRKTPNVRGIDFKYNSKSSSLNTKNVTA